MYEVVLTVRDMPKKDTRIEMKFYKLSEEALTRESEITMEQAEKLELHKKDGACTVMYGILNLLEDMQRKLKK
jgi:hypothetical protein